MDQRVGLYRLEVSAQVQLKPVTGWVVGNPTQRVEVTLQMDCRLGEYERHPAFHTGSIDEKAWGWIQISQIQKARRWLEKALTVLQIGLGACKQVQGIPFGGQQH